MGIERRHIATTLAVVLTVALLVPAVRHLREQPPPPAPAVRLFLIAPPGTELGVGDEPLDAAISPDQREVVFVATQLRRNTSGQAPAGGTQLWRRRLDAEQSEPIPGTEGARLPAWKQTGNVLSFFADAQLKLLNLKTGVVTGVSDAPAPAGATWLRDGSLLFVPGPGVIRRLLDGRVTEASRLAPGDTAHAYPIAIAPSQHFVYVAVRGDGQRIVRLNEDGNETDLGRTTAQAALVEGDRDALLFVKDETLMMDEREPDTGRMAGRDLPVALHLGATRSGRGLFTASADVLVHASAAERPRQLTWLTMEGERVGTVADVGDYWQVRLSPDDARVASTSRDPLLRSLDVQVIPADAALPALRLTASIAADSDPVWSPDGRQLLFRSMQRGQPEIFITPSSIDPLGIGDRGLGIRDRRRGIGDRGPGIRDRGPGIRDRGPGIRAAGPGVRDSGSRIGADDRNPARPLNTSGDVATDWRGTEMLIQRRGKSGFDLVRVATQGGGAVTGAPVSVAESPFNETDGRWSPDGRWVAYVSDEPGQPDVYVVNGTTRQRISSAGGTRPRWTRDSRALLFLRGSTVMRADLNPAGTRFESPRQLFDAPGIRDFDVAHLHDRVLALMPVRIEPVSSVPVIINWRSLLPVDRPGPRGVRERPAPVL